MFIFDMNLKLRVIFIRPTADVALVRLIAFVFQSLMNFEDGETAKVFPTLFTLEGFELLMVLEKKAIDYTKH